jgi:hypothetical protein
MGEFVKRQQTTGEVLHNINRRFAPGEPLQEMVQIQKEFQVFSSKHSLQQSYRLLNVGPSDYTERPGVNRALERLKLVPSDVNGVNGHDRIVKARQENLESSQPLPMFNKTHKGTDDKRVIVTRGKPIPHEDQEYMIISIPTKQSKSIPTPVTRPAAPKRTTRKKART